MNQLQSIAPTTFNGTPVTIIDHAGQRWLTAKEVGLCLGYGEANVRIGISNLYSRHSDEFTVADTCVINLITQGQKRETRVFSATGCQLLGFFANTERAKQFRAWAKQALAAMQANRPHVPTPAQKGGDGRLRITRQVEFDVLTLFVQGQPQSAIAKQMAISTSTVCNLLHAKYRFSPDAGQALTTPELIQAVGERHMSWERERIAKKYCASSVNLETAHHLDSSGQGLLFGAAA